MSIVSLPTLHSAVEQAAKPIVEILSPAKAVVSLGEQSTTITSLLASGDSNTKLRKSSGKGYATIGLSLLPWKLHGCGNICPFASPTCAVDCLNFCGYGQYDSTQFGRFARRVLWHKQRRWFLARLHAELVRETNKADALGLRLACRMNVLSDIAWENFNIMDLHPRVQFYDYTKDPHRIGLVRPNYWVTFSRSELNEDLAIAALDRRYNVAVVFHDPLPRSFIGKNAKLQRIPKTWEGFDCIDGDQHDLRFQDPRGRSRGGKVVALRLKAANHDHREHAIVNGFSVSVEQYL